MKLLPLALVCACAHQPAPIATSQHTAIQPGSETAEAPVDEEPPACPEGGISAGGESDYFLENPDAPNVCLERDAEGTCVRLERHGTRCAPDVKGCLEEPVNERCVEIYESSGCKRWEPIDN